MKIKLLIFGDVYGRVGRRMMAQYLPELRAQHNPDFVVANVENLTGGKGPSLAHLDELEALGVDVFTGGNHIFARMAEIQEKYLQNPSSRLARPANYFESETYKMPGKGWAIAEKDGKRILVINLMSGLFLREQMDNPFLAADRLLAQFSGEKFDAIVIDFHRETTSEMYCLAEYLDGRASLVYGTHTHVQTNDEHILRRGTGMITDMGMIGPLHSAIGQEFPGRIAQMLTGTSLTFGAKVSPMREGPGSLHALLVEIEDGKCLTMEKIRIRDNG